MSADLSQALERMAEQVIGDFEATLREALTRLLASPESADKAMADSACVLEGGTLAWRVDPTTLMAELFCDIGLPEPAHTQEAYRLSLEANLNRACPGVYVGVHAGSGRLVATSAVSAVLMAEETFCTTALANLATHARDLRAQALPCLGATGSGDQA